MENIPDWDPSLPKFRFTQAERDEKKKKGLTDAELDQQELAATTKLVEDAVEKERKVA